MNPRSPTPSSPSSPGLNSSPLTGVLDLLAGGGVVGYPTETVWGLAALPDYASALVLRKGREPGKPLQVSCAQPAQALAMALPNPALARLASVWPGPLTVVTRARPDLPYPPDALALLAPGGRIGLRVPAHPAARALLDLAGGVLATTSLNPSGLPAATSSAQAEAYRLADRLLGSDLAGLPATEPGSGDGQASTVLSLPDAPGEAARVLRAGALGMAELRALLAPLGMTVEDGEGRGA